MKRRFTLDDSGQWVDRDGGVLNVAKALSLGCVIVTATWGGPDLDAAVEVPDPPETSRSTGTYRGSSSVEEQQSLLEEQTPYPSEAAVEDPIGVVWATYVEVMEPRSKALDRQGRAVIREALKVATVEECCTAIHGCKASRFHMGDNERRKPYNRLTNILKGKQGGKTTREQIDLFLDVAATAGVQSQFSSAGSAKVQQAKREVLTGWEFPHDEVVVRRGEEAARWLRAQGFGISYGPDGRPSFLPPTLM